MTKKDFFMAHASQFAFELNADQLITKGLKDKFIIKVSNDNYEYTNNFLDGTKE